MHLLQPAKKIDFQISKSPLPSLHFRLSLDCHLSGSLSISVSFLVLSVIYVFVVEEPFSTISMGYLSHCPQIYGLIAKVKVGLKLTCSRVSKLQRNLYWLKNYWRCDLNMTVKPHPLKSNSIYSTAFFFSCSNLLNLVILATWSISPFYPFSNLT